MPDTSSTPKAAPSSTLPARQEALLWGVVDVAFIAILLLISATFLSVDSDSFLTATLIAPLVGWVVGNVLAFAVPRHLTAPSWMVAAIGLVVVVACAVIFQQGSTTIAIGRGIAGFAIGLAIGFLFLRALFASRGHRQTAV